MYGEEGKGWWESKRSCVWKSRCRVETSRDVTLSSYSHHQEGQQCKIYPGNPSLVVTVTHFSSDSVPPDNRRESRVVVGHQGVGRMSLCHHLVNRNESYTKVSVDLQTQHKKCHDYSPCGFPSSYPFPENRLITGVFFGRESSLVDKPDILSHRKDP